MSCKNEKRKRVGFAVCFNCDEGITCTHSHRTKREAQACLRDGEPHWGLYEGDERARSIWRARIKKDGHILTPTAARPQRKIEFYECIDIPKSKITNDAYDRTLLIGRDMGYVILRLVGGKMVTVRLNEAAVDRIVRGFKTAQSHITPEMKAETAAREIAPKRKRS